MSTVKDIYDAIDRIAPFDTAMSFDNVGILVGDKNRTVTKAVIALDITKEVVNEAINSGTELIISHHPIIFDPLKAVDSGSVLYALIKSGISAICCHTNLDIAEAVGVNFALADALQIKNVSRVGECLFIGETDKAYGAEEMAHHIKEKLHAERVLFTPINKKINKVAFCSGAGGNYIEAAATICDAFITGEAHHHELLFAAHNNLSMFAAGHYETEKIFDKALNKYLENNITDTEFLLSQAEINPVTAI